MLLKLFIVGLPGSGKSAMSRYIKEFVRRQFWSDAGNHWSTVRFNDYPILHTMFTDDKERKRFEPADPSGFNVRDFSAFDDALKSLGDWITWHITSKQAQPQEILLIEFARNDYRVAFHQFKPELLQDAHFIYLGSDVKVCQERIRERAAHPENEEDDYPVSDHIFKTYYCGDNGNHFLDILQEFGIAKHQVLALDNNRSLEDARREVEAFVVQMLDPAICCMLAPRQTDKLTMPAPV
ncbi:MAG TPA: hypothetical protein VJO32_00740 [Ktedonobacteraceae bacterium]|nr:hypothetical protein [Ktedonobacteraceae bacterium]